MQKHDATVTCAPEVPSAPLSFIYSAPALLGAARKEAVA
jgi:hypothetical protein